MDVSERSSLLGDAHCDRSPEAGDYSESEGSCRRRVYDSHSQGGSVKERAYVSPEDKLSAVYESLDYDICENMIYQREQKSNTQMMLSKRGLTRWFLMILIGVLTGLCACVIDIMVLTVTDYKYTLVKKLVDSSVKQQKMYEPFLTWLAINMFLVILATTLTVYFAPVAAGSGIPQIKCFLNGVKIPGVVRLKILFVKVIGVVCAVAGGLAVGKEGPMIHSGAVFAAGVSQGRSSSLKFDLKIFEYFRTDTEKRDFVSGGAAAGVAAAFGAPVGGVLFSLEEGASFWNQALTWRIFVCSMMSTFTLNVVQSYIKDRPWDLSYPGLINFGKFDSNKYESIELIIFIAMGALGGLLGAIFNYINHKLTIFRLRYIHLFVAFVFEAMMVAAVTTTINFLTIYFSNDCQPMKASPPNYLVQFFCEDGQYSATATMLFQTPEKIVKNLFHEEPGSYKLLTLILCSVGYFLMACWTYGLCVPSGLFIPCILIGAAWGRIVGLVVKFAHPNAMWADPGKYALIGAAAQLGGVVRMTISLTVIIIEATGNLTFGLPIMITIIVAKLVGDFFNEGIYDMHVHLQCVPLLGWEPPHMTDNISAKEVMSQPVVVFRSIETVGRIVDVLRLYTHNGFPVVRNYDPRQCLDDGRTQTFGRFRGIILRTQLLVLLKLKAFNEREDLDLTNKNLQSRDFREEYPRFSPIQKIHISSGEREMTIDLLKYMNSGAHTISDSASFPRIFKLFRALGLRHLVVINENHEVMGIVTRKDLARYKVSKSEGQIYMKEMIISAD